MMTKTSFTGLKSDISEQYMKYQKDKLFCRLKQENYSVLFFPSCTRREKKLLRTYVTVIVQEGGMWEMVGTARRQKMKEEWTLH